MGNREYWKIAVLVVIPLLIYYPLFYSRYVYSDEVVQLWHYRTEPSYAMFTVQGRYLNNLLFHLFFGSISGIARITWLRVFSLLGWICCIPAWYVIISRICAKEGLSRRLPFYSLLYLVVCPPFTISVSWASVMELFIANTAGLTAGYIFYANRGPLAIALSVPLGLVSLFTYQHGFGCFLVPFILHAAARGRPSRLLYRAVLLYLSGFLLYYFLFKWQLHFLGITANERTGLAPNPFSKLLYFLARPLSSAFHFTWLTDPDSLGGRVSYGIILAGFLWLNRRRGLLCLMLFLFLILLVYLPSLAVRENYASNRTMLALDLAVFLLTFISLAPDRTVVRGPVKTNKPAWKQGGTALVWIMTTLFLLNGFYNFRCVFLRPVRNEYHRIRSFVDRQYDSRVDTIEFVRPPEDLFVRKYDIPRSMDEFGVPSTSPRWVPDPFMREVVLEITRSRIAAGALTVTDTSAHVRYRDKHAGGHVLVVDVPDILR
jgi:hypothetical protein